MGAGALLDRRNLRVTVLGGQGELAVEHADALLTLGSFLTVLALLDEANSARVLTLLLDLAGEGLSFPFIGTIEFVLNHLKGELLT